MDVQHAHPILTLFFISRFVEEETSHTSNLPRLEVPLVFSQHVWVHIRTCVSSQIAGIRNDHVFTRCKGSRGTRQKPFYALRAILVLDWYRNGYKLWTALATEYYIKDMLVG